MFIFIKRESLLLPCCLSCKKTDKITTRLLLKEVIKGREKRKYKKEERMRYKNKIFFYAYPKDVNEKCSA